MLGDERQRRAAAEADLSALKAKLCGVGELVGVGCADQEVCPWQEQAALQGWPISLADTWHANAAMNSLGVQATLACIPLHAFTCWRTPGGAMSPAQQGCRFALLFLALQGKRTMTLADILRSDNKLDQVGRLIMHVRAASLPNCRPAFSSAHSGVCYELRSFALPILLFHHGRRTRWKQKRLHSSLKPSPRRLQLPRCSWQAGAALPPVLVRHVVGQISCAARACLQCLPTCKPSRSSVASIMVPSLLPAGDAAEGHHDGPAGGRSESSEHLCPAGTLFKGPLLLCLCSK